MKVNSYLSWDEESETQTIRFWLPGASVEFKYKDSADIDYLVTNLETLIDLVMEAGQEEVLVREEISTLDDTLDKILEQGLDTDTNE